MMPKLISEGKQQLKPEALSASALMLFSLHLPRQRGTICQNIMWHNCKRSKTTSWMKMRKKLDSAGRGGEVGGGGGLKCAWRLGK